MLYFFRTPNKFSFILIIYNKSAKSTLAFCLYLVQNGGEMASNEESKEQKLMKILNSSHKSPPDRPSQLNVWRHTKVMSDFSLHMHLFLFAVVFWKSTQCLFSTLAFSCFEIDNLQRKQTKTDEESSPLVTAKPPSQNRGELSSSV